MSRPYKISISESIHRIIRAEDHVRSHLELLPVLPPQEMGKILGEELKKRGFEIEDGQAVRRQDGIEVLVDLETGDVVVQTELEQEIDLSKKQQGSYYGNVTSPDERHCCPPKGSYHNFNLLKRVVRVACLFRT